jgi:hypothetical protein
VTVPPFPLVFRPPADSPPPARTVHYEALCPCGRVAHWYSSPRGTGAAEPVIDCTCN